MQIYNFVVSELILEKIISEIKEKPTLRNMDAVFITEQIKKYLEQNVKALEKLENKKSKEYKELIKNVRKKCHDIYEIFQTKTTSGDRLDMVEKIEDLSIDSHLPVLKSHLSTKERIPNYKKFYEDIYSTIGYPKSILDIGCGFNPFSLPFMHIEIEGLQYCASDLSYDDLKVIEAYFSRIGMIGSSTFRMNLIKDYKQLKKYPTDVCFAFKLFDVLESQKENISYEIIKAIPSKYLVATFPMQNIKAKSMKRTHVSYFERMLRNLNLNYKLISYPNELVYIVYDKKIKKLKGQKAKDL